MQAAIRIYNDQIMLDEKSHATRFLRFSSHRILYCSHISHVSKRKLALTILAGNTQSRVDDERTIGASLSPENESKVWGNNSEHPIKTSGLATKARQDRTAQGYYHRQARDNTYSDLRCITINKGAGAVFAQNLDPRLGNHATRKLDFVEKRQNFYRLNTCQG